MDKESLNSDKQMDDAMPTYILLIKPGERNSLMRLEGDKWVRDDEAAEKYYEPREQLPIAPSPKIYHAFYSLLAEMKHNWDDNKEVGENVLDAHVWERANADTRKELSRLLEDAAQNDTDGIMGFEDYLGTFEKEGIMTFLQYVKVEMDKFASEWFPLPKID